MSNRSVVSDAVDSIDDRAEPIEDADDILVLGTQVLKRRMLRAKPLE